jgi:heme-degrading monooxygenase HmoA
VIARRWTARASDEGARAYVAFFEGVLVPQLDRIEGHRGALVMTRSAEDGDGVDITVLTFWASMEAISRFAGPAPDRAVVEPDARALLLDFDERVAHEEVAVHTLRAAPG